MGVELETGQEQGTKRRGVNSVQAELGSAHRRKTDSRGGHAGAGVQAAKRDLRAAEAAPRLSPSKGARVRRTHTTPTPVRRSPRVPSQKDTRPYPPGHPTPSSRAHAPRAGGAYVPSNTQSTSRATYGSRVLSNIVSAPAARRGRWMRHTIHDTGPGGGDGPKLRLLSAGEEPLRADEVRAAL